MIFYRASSASEAGPAHGDAVDRTTTQPSLSRQCELLGVSRSTAYYKPKPVKPETSSYLTSSKIYPTPLNQITTLEMEQFMTQVLADRRDVDFVLHEQLEVEKLSANQKFVEFSRKTIDLIVSEARKLAIKEMFLSFKVGDEEGCTFEKGKVRVPKSFHHLHRLFAQGEWIAMCDSPEWGGQGMPTTVALAAKNYFNAANFPFVLHQILSHGAGKLVEKFGTEKQKKLFLKKLYTGQWGGTMLLTEPEAGSDVGALTTTAVQNDDGTYSISGNKIFITSGENDLVENIIHLVLARIDKAIAGTLGISLFLVPKIWVNEDGCLGEFNDVVCTGIEEKMGIHGSPTCSITLGGKGQCRGILLGEKDKGMRAMFVMMNEARLEVGMQAMGCASASFMNALNYARQRIQGRHLHASGKDASPVPIYSTLMFGGCCLQ
jgi:hypothetical protein